VSWFLAFAGFAALIILHEFGHFIAAKAVGMRVERFSLFFGPLLLRVRRGETEYGIGPIPLGGYVRITGMNPEEDIEPEVAPRAYFRQPVWKRIVVIAAGPLVNLVVAFAIIWAILLSQGLAKSAIAVYNVEQGGAAHGVLLPNDLILSVDGQPGYDTHLSSGALAHREQAIQKLIADHHCAGRVFNGCRAATAAKLVVRRGAHTLNLSIFPRYDASRLRTRLGLAFGLNKNLGVLSAASQSITGMWLITKDTVTAVVRRFISPRDKQISGVVGAYETTRQSFTFGITDALQILAIISLSLAVVNLFPFLPLDGGHIFWALAEKLRGRAIPFAIMERAGMVGFVLVIFLFLTGLVNDIGRLQGQGFTTR